MRKIVLHTVFALFISLLFACSGQNVKQEEKLGKVKETKSEISPKGSMDFLVVDELISTQWVKEIPKREGMQTFTGELVLRGNEPFTYSALKINDMEKYGLIGSKKFIEYLKSHNGKLKVSGVIELKEEKKWLKVYYVIEGGTEE